MINVIKLFCLQKIIYKQMKIAGAVRVIKGQEVLQDGSTLEEHGITDGSTVNIVIEPDKEINLKLKLGPKEFTQKIKNSMSVRELKKQLIDGDIVGFMLDEFQLIISAAENEGVTDNVPLVDETLPLHLCGVSDNTALKIMGWSIMIQLINQKGDKCFKYFPRKMTVKQMKQEISPQNISLFLECGTRYRKFEGDGPIGDVLSHNDVVHYIEDKFFQPEQMIVVNHKAVAIEKIGFVSGETVLSLKLRVQEHLGTPVSRIVVQVPRAFSVKMIHLRNDQKLQYAPDHCMVSVS